LPISIDLGDSFDLMENWRHAQSDGCCFRPNGFGLDPIALRHRVSAAGELGREAAE